MFNSLADSINIFEKGVGWRQRFASVSSSMSGKRLLSMAERSNLYPIGWRKVKCEGEGAGNVRRGWGLCGVGGRCCSWHRVSCWLRGRGERGRFCTWSSGIEVICDAHVRSRVETAIVRTGCGHYIMRSSSMFYLFRYFPFKHHKNEVKCGSHSSDLAFISKLALKISGEASNHSL